MTLQPAPGTAFTWADRSTLRAAVEVEPWSLDRLDEGTRRELEAADALVYTAVWDLTPAPGSLPDELVLELSPRR